MTKEQAIEYLKADIKHWENTSVSTEHLDMAIKALEQQPSEDCVSRADLLSQINKSWETIETKLDFVNIVKALPPITPIIPTSEDCVSRQAVKTAIYNHCYVTEDGLYFEGNVEHIINNLPPVTPTQRWIPVSERLPASDEDVLVTNGKGMYIGWIDPTDKCWRVDSECEYFMNDIVAWQPLPKPYEEKAR